MLISSPSEVSLLDSWSVRIRRGTADVFAIWSLLDNWFVQTRRGTYCWSLQRYCAVVARCHKNWTRSGEHDGQQKHTWLETNISWNPSNGHIYGSPWQAKWHRYLPWSISMYNLGRVFVTYKTYRLGCHRDPIDR
jgi:hypothetical protein